MPSFISFLTVRNSRLPASTTTTPDGTVLGGDGKPLGKLRPDGMVVGEDGRVLGKMASDGSIVKAGPGDKLAENTTTRPDGTVLDANGRALGKLNRDGLLIDPNGK